MLKKYQTLGYPVYKSLSLSLCKPITVYITSNTCPVVPNTTAVKIFEIGKKCAIGTCMPRVVGIFKGVEK